MRHVLKTTWLPFVCITLWGGAIYSNTLGAPFVFDDLVYIQNNPLLKGPLRLFPIIELAPSRWIGFFTFAVNYYFGHENALGYHLVNLAIHIGVAICCYGLVLLTFNTPRLKDQTGSDLKSPVALLAGLLFVSHPVQTEAVTYVWQRVESLTAFFYLLSLVSYVKYRLEEERKQQSSRVHLSLYYLASCVLAYMAGMTKEVAVTLPATIILYEIVFFGNFTRRFKKVMLRAVPFLCLMIVVPILAKMSPVVTKNFLYESPPTWPYLLTQTRAVATYLRLLVWPVQQNLDYDIALSESVLEPGVVWGTLLIISVVVIGVCFYKTSPMITFGMLWFFTTLLPTSSIIALPDFMFEHRLYLPLVGFSFVLSGIVAIFTRHWKPASTAVIIVVLLFSAGTYRRNSVWQSELTLWQDTVRKSPRKVRPRVNLATSYIKLGEYDKALVELTRALALEPDSAAAYENMSRAYARKGDYKQALTVARKALELAPDQASAYDAVAEAYMHLGQKDLAVKNFRKALSLDPSRLGARNNLGLTLAEKGLYREAIVEFETLLKLDPRHKDASFNLARAYTLSGQVDRAVRQYQMVITLDPTFLEAYHNLGILYLEVLNRPHEAKRCFEHVLTLTKEPEKAALIQEIIRRIEGGALTSG
jgi:tetratricopeptide (TPR) repeat protein